MQPQDITDVRYRHGVIDPTGKFYPCHYEGHNWLAQYLQKHNIIPADRDEYCYFEEEGWIKLTEALSIECEFEFTFHPTIRVDGNLMKVEKMPTKEQIDAIMIYKKSRGEEDLIFNCEKMTLDEFLKEVNTNFSYWKNG